MPTSNSKGLFKCPVCHRLHPFNQGDELSEVNCTDNSISEIRQIKGRLNDDALTVNNWNQVRFDTRVTDYTQNLELIDIGRHNSHPKNVKNW